MAVEVPNYRSERLFKDRKDRVNKEKRFFKGHEFELKFTSNNKQKANREAEKYHRRGFHTRVREMSPGLFFVYCRRKKIETIPHYGPK